MFFSRLAAVALPVVLLVSVSWSNAQSPGFPTTSSDTVASGYARNSVLAQAPKNDPEVVFNKQSLIYHRASCSAAQRCTKNCVTVRLSEARARGGRACKLCGGPATSLQDGSLREHRHNEFEAQRTDAE
jgi:hypothetical protein